MESQYLRNDVPVRRYQFVYTHNPALKMHPKLVHFRFIQPKFGLFQFQVCSSYRNNIVELQHLFQQPQRPPQHVSPQSLASSSYSSFNPSFHPSFHSLYDPFLQTTFFQTDKTQLVTSVKRIKYEYDQLCEIYKLQPGCLWRERLDSPFAYSIHTNDHGHFF